MDGKPSLDGESEGQTGMSPKAVERLAVGWRDGCAEGCYYGALSASVFGVAGRQRGRWLSVRIGCEALLKAGF